MQPIRRINLLGGPGVGKSTNGAQLFSDFKKEHRNVELVNEYVKLWAYEKRVVVSGDQVHIFAEQQRRELLPLRGGVDFVISDSPLWLCAVYGKLTMPQDWKLLLMLADAHERDFPSLNIYLARDNELPYQQLGRYHTRDQAATMDDEIWNTLKAFGVPMTPIRATDYASIRAAILAVL